MEIDEEVIKTSEEYFPNIACGLQDPRVTIHFDDGASYIKDLKFQYDVIIDSTDPFSVGEFYLKKNFAKHSANQFVNMELSFHNLRVCSTTQNLLDMHEFKLNILTLWNITIRWFQLIHQAWSAFRFAPMGFTHHIIRMKILATIL